MRASSRGFAFSGAFVVLLGLPATAGVVRQLTDVKTTLSGPGALDDAGGSVFCGASAQVGGANPEHAFQLLRFDAVTGASTLETSAPEGVSVRFSVSDDGRYLAFPSPADLTGLNHDQSTELFVLDRIGGSITQLTNDPALTAGSVSTVAISGNGTRIAFVANTDPLGTNPQHENQLFASDRSGAGLVQLTALGPGASLGGIAISDDGTRIAFASTGDLTGGNADRGSEIFAIEAAGTNLRQLTSALAPYGSSAPALSGNGQRIAFQSDDDSTGGNASHWTEIFVIDWAGTGLRRLTATARLLGLTGDPASQTPSITDDGMTVVYSSNNSRLFPPLNLDGNFEIFKIKADGTGLTALTSTLLSFGALFPSVAGAGGRIAYYTVGTNVTLDVMDGAGGGKRTLLTFDLIFNGEQDVDADGGQVTFVRSTGILASAQVWKVAADGSGLSQVTSFVSGSAAAPSFAGDGRTIVFSADADPLGTNADASEEVFAVFDDGTGLRQLTSGATGTASRAPVAAAAADLVVFESDADPTGGNADASMEIFKIGLDGTGIARITNGPAGTTSRAPRVDATGTWVVFESNADPDGGNPDGSYEVWRARLDGAALERLTGSALFDSGSPDVSDDGLRVVFASAADPLGTNPEGNVETFLFDAATSSLRQLTSFAAGNSGGPRISGNGAWVYFASNAPVFESDPDLPGDLYRVPAVGGAIERVGALRAAGIGSLGSLGGVVGGGDGLAVDRSGAIAAFTGFGNFTGGNEDLLSEIWLLDRNATPAFEVGKAAPTVLAWTPASGPVRYDAIRGELANVRAGAGVIDLGPVRCLEKDSPDATTAGFGDPDDPLPGRVFFFLYRGSQGLADGPGSFGTSTNGLPRVAGAGGC